jgi:small-conductance mechanosensitive channel
MDFLAIFQEVIPSEDVLARKFLASALVVFIFCLISWMLMLIVLRRITDVKLRYQWKKIIQYTVGLVCFLIVGRIWFAGFKSVSTFLGLVSAGLTIALRDLVVDLAGWVFIIWRRPFEVGDRIQIGDHAGDVIDLRIFKFTLLEIGNWVDADQSTGRIIHVPNGQIFTRVLANYSKGFQYIWNEIPVLITFESHWKEAKGILHKIAVKHAEHLSEAAEKRVKESSQRFMIFYSKLTPVVYTDVKDSGVMLTLRYLTEPRKRRSSAEAIWEDILEAFAERKDIDFAYPTQRFFNHAVEGKGVAGLPDAGQ